MKKLILILLAFTSTSVWASSLDLIDSAPGSFWGKIDSSPTNSEANHIQFDAEQGVKFEHLTWATWYVSMVWWQNTGLSKNSYWAYGVKDDTLIPHFILGIEEENYVFSTQPVPINALVGYVSTSFDWNLKKD